MLPKKNSFVFIILSFICMVSCSGGIHEDEYGYDFHAYPSPFSLETSFEGSLANSTSIVDVFKFGAKGDGKSDDTKAFGDAWNAACTSSIPVTFLVPGKTTYLVYPFGFKGPCKSFITLQVLGTIQAPNDPKAFEKDIRHWITFEGIENLKVEGVGGTFDGNGQIWWDNSCKRKPRPPACRPKAPTALTFYKCNNLVLKDITIQNSQQIHVNIQNCVTVQVFDLKINSPETSPNTDGIHVTNTQDIRISNANIKAGDDCISIESGTQKLNATQITCGPGHRISIGSLGDNQSEAQVSDIEVDGATLSGTTNGVRIKTYQGGSGLATNIRFKNVIMDNVKYPIIIDQNYCDQNGGCPPC